ncbi:hypothetical protein F2P79_000516 [Pimephales promelas]|nr:hypothetical protein F2P79_000516 [Pimephales promelas]
MFHHTIALKTNTEAGPPSPGPTLQHHVSGHSRETRILRMSRPGLTVPWWGHVKIFTNGMGDSTRSPH